MVFYSFVDPDQDPVGFKLLAGRIQITNFGSGLLISDPELLISDLGPTSSNFQ
jgi:hypothetical protein